MGESFDRSNGNELHCLECYSVSNASLQIEAGPIVKAQGKIVGEIFRETRSRRR